MAFWRFSSANAGQRTPRYIMASLWSPFSPECRSRIRSPGRGAQHTTRACPRRSRPQPITEKGPTVVHRTRIVSAAATLSLLLFAAAAPSSGAEQPDNTWVAESLEGVGIIASVNGLVTHGDRFIVRLSARNCGVGVTWFSFYTHAMNPDLPALKGKTIPALANGERIKIRINGSSKFLVGRIVYMSMGIFRLKALVGKLKGAETLTIKLLDTVGFKASEYFQAVSEQIGLRPAGLARSLCG